ncbi:hypothetical protein VSVS12_03549 [Vibrio scophthalmi]|uniref:hypothetical protein n=1 Tax=Vibrio scophthalmi TaxID=45658 RepID=UPI000809431B|nr:hypothetical protein [Vibrio scophthalmi]ANS87258.1 hypothetical protein VSVS12_03549 [Vibrio scophthalmi]
MNPKHIIIDSDLTPVWRGFFQKLSLYLGGACLVWFAFTTSIGFSVSFSLLLTAYIVVSFVLKTKKRQQVWLEGDRMIASRSTSLSPLDKIVLPILTIICLSSNAWLLFDLHFIAAAFVGYQLCAFYFVYHKLQQTKVFSLNNNIQTGFFARGYGQCLLVARFDVYTLDESRCFVGTLELNDKDVEPCLNNLAKHMSVVKGTVKVKQEWKESWKLALGGFAGFYFYLFLIPTILKYLAPVGYHWNSKIQKTVYRDEFISNVSIIGIMVLISPLCILFGIWVYDYYLDLKEQKRSAITFTNSDIFFFPSTKFEIEPATVSIPISDFQYILWPKEDHREKQAKLIVDETVQLIDKNGDLISISTWIWAVNPLINHLVRLGTPIRLK